MGKRTRYIESTCLVSFPGSDHISVMISVGTSLRHNLLPRTSGNLQCHMVVKSRMPCCKTLNPNSVLAP